MSLAYLLAGENLELAEADLKGFLGSQGMSRKIERKGKLAISEAEPNKGQLRRLALTHEVSEVLERVDIENLEVDFNPEGSYSVRCFPVQREVNKKGLEKRIGEELSENENHVDLETPDVKIRCYVTKDEVILCKLVEDIDRGLYEKRTNEKRPFSSPVSLDPVLARVLVNLSEVPPGGHLLDPFCGTGGVLIEAGLCGIGVNGSDSQEKMVEGAKENLEEYGIIVHDLRTQDISKIDKEFDNTFDALVTDLPYGKASKTEGKPIDNFLELKDEVSDTAVYVYDEPELGDKKADFEVYVHKNLTRYIFVD